MKKYLFLIFFLSIASISFGWWDISHMAIAKIAYDRLQPDVKKEVDRLIALIPAASSPDFITSACWADDIQREDGFVALRTWHYFDYPYDPEGILSPCESHLFIEKQKGQNIIFAIDKAIETLKNPKASDWAKGVMLRFLVHFVGDIHQPVHAVTYFSKIFPQGDGGGNSYPIVWERPCLHAFWDSACGLGREKLLRPLDDDGHQKLEAFVTEVMQRYPSPPDASDLDACHWHRESYNLAVGNVYPGICPNSAPTACYIERGQQVCVKQIVLAGYRLAELLNHSLSTFDK